MQYDAVLFDLDGTLLNTLEDLAASVNFALADACMPTRTIEEVRSFIGNGVRMLITRAAAPHNDEATVRALHRRFTEHYRVHCEDKTRPYDGVTDLLRQLTHRGIPTAIVSNKADYAVGKLAEQYFPGLITVAVGDREGVPRKPSPESLLTTIRQLDAKHPLYVGDSDVDVQTAKAAGVDGIFVTWGFRTREELTEAGARRFADDAAQLADMIFGRAD